MVRRYPRCHAGPALRAYSIASDNAGLAHSPNVSQQPSSSGFGEGGASTAGGWGTSNPGWSSAPTFAKPAFTSAIPSTNTLLPHEIEAKKRAALLSKIEEARPAIQKVPAHSGEARPARSNSLASKGAKTPSPRSAPLPFSGPGDGFSRAPPRAPKKAPSNTQGPRSPLTLAGANVDFTRQAPSRRLDTKKWEKAADIDLNSQQASRPSKEKGVTGGARAANATPWPATSRSVDLPPRPEPESSSKLMGWGSTPAFAQPSFAPTSSVDTLLPHEREARERAARLSEQAGLASSAADKPSSLSKGIEPRKVLFKPEVGGIRKVLSATTEKVLQSPRFLQSQRRTPEGRQEWGQLARRTDLTERANQKLDSGRSGFWDLAKEKYPSGLPEVLPQRFRTTSPEIPNKIPGARSITPTPDPSSDPTHDPWAKLEASIYDPSASPAAKPFNSDKPAKARDLTKVVYQPKPTEPQWNSELWTSVDVEIREPPKSGWALRHEIAGREAAYTWGRDEAGTQENGEQNESWAEHRQSRSPAEMGRDRQDRIEKEAKARKRQRGNDLGGREQEFDADSFQERRRRRLERKAEKERAKREALLEAGPIPILLPEFISVANLGIALDVKQDLFLSQLKELGFENIAKDSILTGETAALVAQEYGFEPTVDIGEDEDLKPRPPPEDPSSLPLRPPVVTIMGHVDHGKTTLLDYLRKSSIVSQEHGGITQHIGAFSVKLSTGKQITFLDTPGHAAFLSMRQRGANVTDMVILVVAADDSVKPQTLEALKHARAAKVPIIVAINKVDKDSANVDRVKSDLSAHGVEIEDYGGEVQTICVSGKTGQGMDDLEESIVTLSEMMDIRAEVDGMAEGWVLESSIKPMGRVATVLVKRGTLRPGDHIVAGRVAAKIRSLRNEAGVEVDEAPPGTAVEILGWKEPPAAGDQVLQAPDEDMAKTAARYRQELKDREEDIAHQTQQDLERREKAAAEEAQAAKEAAEANGDADGDAFSTDVGMKTVNFTVKCDVHGSVEAVCAAVLEIGNNEVRPRVLLSATGQITESDVEHASVSGSTILNFNNPVPGHIKRMAEDAGVTILDHNVIYHLAEAVRDTLSEHLAPIISTRVIGEAEILQVFPINIKGRTFRNVAGCRVRNGQVLRNSKVRVMRDGEQIYDGMIPLGFKTLKSAVG